MVLRTLCVLLFCIPVIAQVGINTTSPTASLDINGNLKIRSISEETFISNVKDSILVINGSLVKSVPAASVVELALPSIVKGHFTGTGTTTISLATGSERIPFDTEDFDGNSEFNTSTYTFTAKQDGYYNVYVQIKADPSIAISTNFGVAILKNGAVVNRNEFANIGVLGANVTPPLRNVSTLLQLNNGDTISFNVLGAIAMGSVDILENSQDSFFTINQIR